MPCVHGRPSLCRLRTRCRPQQTRLYTAHHQTRCEQGISPLAGCSTEMRKDKEVVLAAVGLGGLQLQYADPQLQGDFDVVLRAVAVCSRNPNKKLEARKLCVLAAFFRPS